MHRIPHDVDERPPRRLVGAFRYNVRRAAPKPTPHAALTPTEAVQPLDIEDKSSTGSALSPSSKAVDLMSCNGDSFIFAAVVEKLKVQDWHPLGQWSVHLSLGRSTLAHD